jgi:hypothetical protein
VSEHGIQTGNDDTDPARLAQSASTDRRLSRRSFLALGRKAPFVVPVIYTLTAEQALAAGSAPSGPPSCLANGELCGTDTDCCSGNCLGGFCAP